LKFLKKKFRFGASFYLSIERVILYPTLSITEKEWFIEKHNNSGAYAAHTANASENRGWHNQKENR